MRYALVATPVYTICSFEREEQFTKIYKYIMSPFSLKVRLSSFLSVFLESVVDNLNWNSKIIAMDSEKISLH